MHDATRLGILVSVTLVIVLGGATGATAFSVIHRAVHSTELPEPLGSPARATFAAGNALVVSGGNVGARGVVHPTSDLTTAPSLSRPLATNVTVGKGFPGISSFNSSCGCAPPDVQLAVGNTDVVEMVNLEGKIWSKAGTALSSFTLSSFFLTGSDSTSDPKVLFDNASGRWFATLLDITNGTIQVAVSKSGDPTSSWVVYAIPGSPSGDFPDQPILGVDKTLVAVGGNEFSGVTSAFVWGELWALNKTSMLAGISTYFTTFHSTSWFSMHPVKSLSSSTTEYIVMTAGGSKVDLFKLTGSPSAKTSAHLSSATALTVGAFSTPPAAPQKGTSLKLDTSDVRVQDAVWKSNDLWLTFDTGCKPALDTITRACVRLVELSTGATPAVVQDFNLAKAKAYTFYGALSLDGSRNVGVIFGLSNSVTYPQVLVTGHLHGSANGTLLPWKLLKSGAGSAIVACTSGVCRWGDYYGSGADPKGPNLWLAGEYVGASVYWSTWIASIRV